MARCYRGAARFLVAVLSSAPAAHAVVFDAAGETSFEAAAVLTQSFEPGQIPEPDAGDAGDEPELLPEKSDSALHGQWVLSLEQFSGANLPITLPPVASSHRVSLWARGEVVATLEVEYSDDRVDEFAVLYPTGRMTSDGWYELEARGFSIDPERAKHVQIGFFSPVGAEVDALEIVRDGPMVPSNACAGASDKSACAPGQLCMWGQCRNMASRVPALPPPDYREQLVDYLASRFSFLYGPFKNRKTDLPNALLEMEAMRNAGDAWSFWRHYRTAIHRLHDWHTKGSDVSGYLLENPKPIAVCFIEGDADLSQSLAPSHPTFGDVLVSHVGKVNTFGLRPGDRLLAVDGKHPVEWTRSLIAIDGDFWTASNPRTYAEDVSRLNRLIGQFANEIEVLRCDPGTQTCGPASEILSITELEPAEPGTGTGIGCDNRPVLHVPGTPEHHPTGGFFHGIVKESNDQEAIYGLSWSSLSVGNGGSLGTKLEQAVQTWRDQARGVILDHRTGYGGTNLGPPIIWKFLREPTPLDAFEYRQRSLDVGPQSLAEGKAVFEQLMKAGAVEVAGGPNPALDVPVALLIHLDGSASDWLPLGVKGAPRAKIFGPHETAGAFSTLFSFGYWFGIGYSIAVGDTYHFSGDTLNGKGVEPDVVVEPKQSDLLAGKDTVYDAALAWVRQELEP